MTVENKDYLVPAETPAKLSADLKDKMMAMDITNDRFAGKFPGNIMRFVSPDPKQGLLATIQTYTGQKTWTIIGTFLADLICGKVFSTTSINQTITTDNDTLLSVGDTSFLRVTSAVTATPTDFTVGMAAGKRDGHIVNIVVKTDGSAIEINDTVPGSATIEPKTGTLPITIQDGALGPGSISFIWYAADTVWYEL